MEHISEQDIRKLIQSYVDAGEMDAEMARRLLARILKILAEAVMDQKETSRLIGEILDALPDDQRAVVGLFYFDGMSVKEIAEMLAVSENTVKSRLNYARKKIEVEVLALEKKGTKLYNLAPIPFLLWLFKSQRIYAADLPETIVVETAKAGSMAAGTSAVAKKTAKAILKKTIAKIVAVGVIGAAGAGTFALHKRPVEAHYISDFSEIPKEALAEMIEDTEERYLEFLSSDKTIDVKDEEHDFTFWRDHINDISDTEVMEEGYFAHKIDASGYEENILYILCTITIDDVKYTDFTGAQTSASFEEAICVYKLRNIYMNSDGSIIYDEDYVEQTCFYDTKALLEESEFEHLEYAYNIEEVRLK